MQGFLQGVNMKYKLCALMAIFMMLFCACSDNTDDTKSDDTPKVYGRVVVNESRSRYINTFEITKAKVTITGLGVDKTEKTVAINNTTGTCTIDKVPVGTNLAIAIQAYKGGDIVPGEVLYGVIDKVEEGKTSSVKVDTTTSPKGKVYAACIEKGVANFTGVDAAIPSDTNAALINADAIATAKKSNSLAAAATYKLAPGSVEFDIKAASSGRARGMARASSSGLTIYVKSAVGTLIWPWEDNGKACATLMGKDWNNNHPTTVDCEHSGWSKFDIPAEFLSYPVKTIHFKLNKGGELTGANQTFWYDTSASTSEPSDWTSSSGGGGGGDGDDTPVTPTTPQKDTSMTIDPGTVIYIADPLSRAYTVTGEATKLYNRDENGDLTEELVAELTSDKKIIIYGVVPGTWDVYKKVNGQPNANGGYDSGSFENMGSVTVTSGQKTLQSAHNIVLGTKGTDVTPSTPVTPPSTPTTPEEDNTPQTPSQAEGSAVATAYYWTNKNGAVGTEKTISAWTDWTKDEQIAQCAAYDDPRTWRGIQESPYDCYAIYAAYDDANLYLMVELTNCATNGRATFMNHDYAGGDNSDWDNRDIPLGWIFNTGKGPKCVKDTTEKGGKPIWDAVKFSDSQGFNYLTYHSSKCVDTANNKSCGTPGWFKSNGTSFDYGADYTTTYGTKGNGVNVKYQASLTVSTSVWFEATPSGNRAESNQTAADLMSSTNYKDAGKATGSKDCSYMYTIPYAALGIDKAWIKSNGIGVRQLTTGGGSLMDCCPWDPAMVDVVNQPYSCDESTSAEKEDEDTLTTPQARVGHM